MVALHRTNRLAMHLASNGHALYTYGDAFDNDESDMYIYSPVEVEFVSQPASEGGAVHPRSRPERLSWLTGEDSEPNAENTSSFPFPPQTDRLYDQLAMLMRHPYEHEMGYNILPFQEANHHNLFLQEMKHTRRNGEADILWLSTTEFVSFLDFYCRNGEEYTSYSYAMRPPGKLLAYSLPQIDNTNGGFRFGSASCLPLRFVRHVLAPAEVSSFEIEISATTHVDAALALAPTTDQTPMGNTKITFSNPSLELLNALSSYPLHQGVRLCIEVHGRRRDPQALNDLLRGFRFPVHLQVPRALRNFECGDEPFTTNPSFTKLTIATCSTGLSSKMLNGIARNRSMTHVVVECKDSDRYDTVVSVFKDVFFHAFQGSKNLKSFTIVSDYSESSRFNNPSWRSSESAQNAFERLGTDLDFASHNRHSISRFHWSFPNSQRKRRLKSNCLWDSGFSPALVVNYLYGQPGGCPPANLLSLAIRRINQGILFKYATDLVPWDLSASNASAIFKTLITSAEYDWLQNAAAL
jgi:hypothetical protein